MLNIFETCFKFAKGSRQASYICEEDSVSEYGFSVVSSVLGSSQWTSFNVWVREDNGVVVIFGLTVITDLHGVCLVTTLIDSDYNTVHRRESTSEDELEASLFQLLTVTNTYDLDSTAFSTMLDLHSFYQKKNETTEKTVV